MALISGPLRSATTTSQPGSASIGDLYIVPAGASGGWSGTAAGSMVQYSAPTVFGVVTPDAGQSFIAFDTGAVYTYVVSPAGFTATRGVMTSHYSTLAAADTAAVALSLPLVVDSSTALTANLTLASKQVVFAPGGFIDLKLYQLTVSGLISAPAGQRIFDCSRNKVKHPIVVSPQGGGTDSRTLETR